MGEWQPIADAPWNRQVWIKTEKGHEFLAIEGNYACDEQGTPVAAWASISPGDEPECWSDGVCWEQNEEGNRSDWPVSFMTAPPISALHVER